MFVREPCNLNSLYTKFTCSHVCRIFLSLYQKTGQSFIFDKLTWKNSSTFLYMAVIFVQHLSGKVFRRIWNKKIYLLSEKYIKHKQYNWIIFNWDRNVTLYLTIHIVAYISEKKRTKLLTYILKLSNTVLT